MAAERTVWRFPNGLVEAGTACEHCGTTYAKCTQDVMRDVHDPRGNDGCCQACRDSSGHSVRAEDSGRRDPVDPPADEGPWPRNSSMWRYRGQIISRLIAERRELEKKVAVLQAKVNAASDLVHLWENIDAPDDSYAAGDGPDPYERTADLRLVLGDSPQSSARRATLVPRASHSEREGRHHGKEHDDAT